MLGTAIHARIASIRTKGKEEPSCWMRKVGSATKEVGDHVAEKNT